ncbi:unnamed protein product [Absidia cylindrospora]
MSESTSQRNKAIWAGSLALLTVGSVLYFTLLRKPEDSSKPAKDTKSREVVQDKSVKTAQTEVKADIPQKGDVPQAKATVTSKEVETAQPFDQTSAPLVSETTTKEQQQVEDIPAINHDHELEKSPVLTAAPSSTASSDVHPSSLAEQQEPIPTRAPAAAPAAAVPVTNNNNNSNGTGVNGYWQPPANNATFQHSMGWPELFPLQQQQEGGATNEIKPAATVTVNKDITASTTNGEEVATAVETTAAPAEKKKHTKKRMTRMEQIDQQRQNYVPTMKWNATGGPTVPTRTASITILINSADMVICVFTMNNACFYIHGMLKNLSDILSNSNNSNSNNNNNTNISSTNFSIPTIR